MTERVQDRALVEGQLEGDREPQEVERAEIANPDGSAGFERERDRERSRRRRIHVRPDRGALDVAKIDPTVQELPARRQAAHIVRLTVMTVDEHLEIGIALRREVARGTRA